jgi:hypothetical protein
MACKEEGSMDGMPQAAMPPVPVARRKHRLSKGEIWTILALRPRPLPSTDDLDDLTDIFSPEYIAERKRHLEADMELRRGVGGVPAEDHQERA